MAKKTLTRKRWGASLLEHQKGMEKPTSFTSYDRTRAIRPPGFCISEKHGTQEHKSRVVGDLAKSLVKPAVGADDTGYPEMSTISLGWRDFATHMGPRTLGCGRSAPQTPTEPLAMTTLQGRLSHFAHQPF